MSNLIVNIETFFSNANYGHYKNNYGYRNTSSYGCGCGCLTSAGYKNGCGCGSGKLNE